MHETYECLPNHGSSLFRGTLLPLYVQMHTPEYLKVGAWASRSISNYIFNRLTEDLKRDKVENQK